MGHPRAMADAAQHGDRVITLRPYQETGLQAIREELRLHRSVLYCLPCGGGKGTAVAKIVHGAVTRGKQVIFMVHGVALCNDMSRRLSCLGIQHGVLMGGKKRERWHPVQVASIDTLHRMQHRPTADLIILDEARGFLSPTGKAVVESYPDARVIGMDATPARLDGKGLGLQAGGIFDALILGPSEQELIDMGYLVPSITLGVPDGPDLSGVKKQGGDFNQKQLAAVCDKVKLVGDIVEHWLKNAAGRKTVAFGVDQQHARHITEQFRTAGVEWEYVDANTPDDEREAIYSRLEHGSLMGISNCLVVTIGWDRPVVSCIIAARPTASMPLWRQMMGRGSRIHPESGKRDFLILDHAGNCVRHFPFGFFETPPLWSLDGAPTKTVDDDKAPPLTMCKIPVLVPETGVPATFTGPLSPDSKYMLPSFHYFRPGPPACPYCGLPMNPTGRSVEVEAGDLKDLQGLREQAKAEAKQISAAQLVAEEKMKRRYFDLVKIGRDRGYKPGWSLMAYHTEFRGRWPRKQWKNEALALASASPSFDEIPIAMEQSQQLEMEVI